MAKQKDLDRVFIECAKQFATLSKAKRLKVGGVLVSDNRIICTAYNGTPKGYDNKCEIEVVGKLVTKPEVIHCEENLIFWSARYGLKTEGCSMYLTHSPCMACAKGIIQAGIKKVFYEEPYRVLDSLVFLEKNKVKVIQIEGEK